MIIFEIQKMIIAIHCTVVDYHFGKVRKYYQYFHCIKRVLNFTMAFSTLANQILVFEAEREERERERAEEREEREKSGREVEVESCSHERYYSRALPPATLGGTRCSLNLLTLAAVTAEERERERTGERLPV